jgi:hypothetical protein
MTAPEADATVMLCPSEDMLVKAIETLPALAVSDVVLYFSWPSGFAATLNACPALAAGAVEPDVVGVAAALVGAEDDELVLEEELPQPARASRPTARVSIESLRIEPAVAALGALMLTFILQWSGIVITG